MAIVRSSDSSCNPQKTITAGDHKNDKPKGKKNEKSIFVMGDSMAKHHNGWEMFKKLNANCKAFVKTFSGAKTTYARLRKTIDKEHSGSFRLARCCK